MATQRNKSVQYQTTQKFFFVATLKRTNMSQTTQVKIIFCGNTDRNKFVTYHTSQKKFNWKETAKSVGYILLHLWLDVLDPGGGDHVGGQGEEPGGQAGLNK